MTTLVAPEYTERTHAEVLPRVLAVDDCPENLALIKGILGHMELQLVTANSGIEALELLEDGECAVMLLDVSMPDMDGYDVARHMQTTGKLAHVPVIFLTAIDRDDRAVLNGYDAGVVDYLIKPVNPWILQSKIRVFLNLFNARKAQESANQRLMALQQDLIDRRKQAEEAARQIALQRSELEYQNQELLRRNRELDSFAHVVSHDLRQPLQSILDYLELVSIESGTGLNTNVGRWLSACTRLGKSMNVLIADVLEYATLGTQSIVLDLTDCNAALANALERLMSVIKESNVTITHDPLPRVSGSEKLLTRVFQNLISNAVKYKGDAAPRIQVRCHWDQSRGNWVFRVIDNGRGIEPKDFNRIFEMFARGRDTSAVPGTGIGLAICKRIIEAHGGRIWVKSEPHHGSEFCFALPSAPNPQIRKMEQLCPNPDC